MFEKDRAWAQQVVPCSRPRRGRGDRNIGFVKGSRSGVACPYFRETLAHQFGSVSTATTARGWVLAARHQAFRSRKTGFVVEAIAVSSFAMIRTTPAEARISIDRAGAVQTCALAAHDKRPAGPSPGTVNTLPLVASRVKPSVKANRRSTNQLHRLARGTSRAAESFEDRAPGASTSMRSKPRASTPGRPETRQPRP